MSKTIKKMYIQDVTQRLDGVSECVVVGLSGLDAIQTHQVRSDLRSKGIEVLVVKNSLATRALDEVSLGPVAELFDGPSGLAWGGETIVELAKAVQKWADELAPVVVHGGYADGALLGQEQVSQLAKLPSREQLLAEIAARLTAAPGRVVSLANGPASRVLGQIKTIGGDDDEGDGEDESAEAA